MLPTPRKKVTEFPRIGEAARAMGVHRITLWRTLKGHYPDRRRLCERYTRWLRANGGAKRRGNPEVQS